MPANLSWRSHPFKGTADADSLTLSKQEHAGCGEVPAAPGAIYSTFLMAGSIITRKEKERPCTGIPPRRCPGSLLPPHLSIEQIVLPASM
jgi:hypothetical protein